MFEDRESVHEFRVPDRLAKLDVTLSAHVKNLSQGKPVELASAESFTVNGIAKTVAGFLAASVGVRIDVENRIIRLGLIFSLSLLSSALYFFVYRFLLGLTLEWAWLDELFKAIGNSIVGGFPLSGRLSTDQGRKFLT